MVTIYRSYAADGQCVADCYGISTDEKPLNVCNASTFYEMDTKKVYMFDEENKTWHEQ